MIGRPFMERGRDSYAMWESLPGTSGGLVAEIGCDGSIQRIAIHAVPGMMYLPFFHEERFENFKNPQNHWVD